MSVTFGKLSTPSYPLASLLRVSFAFLLFGITHTVFSSSLQLAQNAAARLLTRSRSRHHITEIPASLLQHPVSCRLKFQILFCVYTALNGLSHGACEVLPPYHTVRHLRSSKQRLVSVHRSRTQCCGFSADVPQCV